MRPKMDEILRKDREYTWLGLIALGITVNEIADRVGFSTPRYFSAVFKKNMGCSPTQYKEEQFKNNVQNI